MAGVIFLPLTVLRLFLWVWGGGAGGWWRGWARGAVVARWPGLGWSGHLGRWRPAGGFEQVHPLLLTVPALGKVQGEVPAAGAGGAGGDVDEVAAQGGTPGFGAGEAGQGPGGAQQVMRDSCAGQPGRVGGERARGQVSQRPIGPVREHL